jgi:hypothetical protein
MNTYTVQMEAANGNRKQGLLSGPMPIAALTLGVLALSVVFPYGIGVAVLAWVIALAGALVGAGFATFLLLKESLGKTMIFGYSPSAAYLAGKKTKNAGNSRKA